MLATKHQNTPLLFTCWQQNSLLFTCCQQNTLLFTCCLKLSPRKLSPRKLSPEKMFKYYINKYDVHLFKLIYCCKIYSYKNCRLEVKKKSLIIYFKQLLATKQQNNPFCLHAFSEPRCLVLL